MTHHEAVAAATERVEEEGGEKDKDGGESGRRESNPHSQLGRLELCH
jgi:hypothetical protein